MSANAFKYTVEVSATQAEVWQRWSDVENWHQFDERLEYSFLEEGEKFETGAIGYLKGKGAPKTKFELLNVQPGVGFDERLILPLGQTVVLKRYFEAASQCRARFTHEVHFKGSLKWLFRLFLAGPFRKDIVLVMEAMKLLLEEDP